MQRNDARQILTAQFYQSLSESGVQIDAVPQDQLQAIVNAQADGLFAVLDAMMDDDDPPAASAVSSVSAARAAAPLPMQEEETIIWTGKPYLTIGVRYELTTQRLRIVRGILGRLVEEIELVRVRDTKAQQHTGERLLNVGDITVVSTDPSTPEFTLNNVKDPFDVRELIRKATIEEKERRGLHYREEM